VDGAPHSQHPLALPLPGFYLNAWYATGGLEHVDRDWFCQVARGGNIRRLPGVPAGLTKRAAHLMAGAPDHFSIRQAMRFGQLRALELPETFIDLVLRQPMATNFGADGIWLPFFMMVARDGSLDAEEFLSELEHCVASYGSKCLAGKSAIFSLRRWEADDQYWDPWLTIEVDTRNRHILQMRSVWNHDPVPRELDMVRAWCKARDIKLDS
jgi:hypothetical protein